MPHRGAAAADAEAEGAELGETSFISNGIHIDGPMGEAEEDAGGEQEEDEEEEVSSIILLSRDAVEPILTMCAHSGGG